MKILLVLDALDFNKDQLGYSAYIAQRTNGQVTALFIENIVQVVVPLSKCGHLGNYPFSGHDDADAKKEIVDKNIETYKQAFAETDLDGSLLRVWDIPLEDTIEASRFADLLLIASGLSFGIDKEAAPAKFVEEVLTAAQSPVLVMPNNMQPINEVIFTYNGSYSSVYANKQFTHLFPSFKNTTVTVLYVSENDDEAIANKRYIKEYLQHHYDNVEFKFLTGTAAAAIFSHLIKQQNCIVTVGAYGRSKISQFFNKSKAENILKTLDMPVFTTHP